MEYSNNQKKSGKGLALFTLLTLLTSALFTPTQATNAATCSDASSTFCVGATVSPSPGVVNQNGTITATIGNQGGAMQNAIVDIEIYNAANQKVHQQYYEWQNLPSNTQKTYSFQWKPTVTGQYTVKAGIFTEWWSRNVYWTDRAGTFTVNQPAPVVAPTPTTPVQTVGGSTATPTINVWWPTNNARISGTQPFKAMVPGKNLSDYRMYWQVDNDRLNLMPDNMTDGPHKESLVNVDGWNWRGNGPYEIKFVAIDAKTYQTIAKQRVAITINRDGGSASVVTLPSQPTQPAPTPTPTPTPVQPVSPAPIVTVPPTNIPAADITFTVNSNNQQPISPYIYGTNFEGNPNSWDGSSRNLTFARFGGNRLSTYNWENNASNAGSDWQQQSDGYLGGGDTPGEAVRMRTAMAHNSNAAMLVTVPMLGHVAEDKRGDGDVGNTPNYLTTRFEQTVAKKNGALSLTPTLGDGSVYQDEFVNFIENSFPNAKTDPRKKIFYSLDNEPDLWSHTHPRLQTQAVTYDGLINKSITYANAIKSVAPHGLVFGAANYGYAGFLHLQNAPDANGRNFIDTYLAGMKAGEQQHGKRLLDVMDIHWYPEAQGDGRRIIEDDASPGIAEARMQAPRSLWDPTYKENSWIANDVTRGPIALIPWMKTKINNNYPGTKLAITEYYYGGGNHISGGIAQADVLGIFGREGLFAANLWHLGNTDHKFIYGGFAMFRNFDGRGSTFGDTSITATTNDNNATSVYASVDKNNANRIVIVAINKSGSAKTTNIALTHGTQMKQAAAYQLTQNSATPVAAGTYTVNNNAFQYTMPANSVTTFVVTQ
ncbi:MAG TPA: glycoside hydrolase family 44 protein [Candidatus Kapabacteria bacterium]|nr:glycoside hydrolase family 44 protein [Candidatus Kapabacteria bacterium]